MENWQLKPGDTVETTEGGKVNVKSRLGGGGQGEVYLVDFNGAQKALKWYKPSGLKNNKTAFYNNLKSNITAGSPSDAFLWPEHLTKESKGTFGYIMRLRPSGYEDVAKFLKAKIHFASEQACINACLKIANAFKLLHNEGLSYQDLNDGNFFINPQDGDVLVCDNDNVAEYGKALGIAGKPGYMAPEIIIGEKSPDRWTDSFSLAVMLFLLTVLDRPFEGKMTLVPALTEKHQRQFFGERPVFIFDPNNDENRPVRGVHKNAAAFWVTYPDYIQNAFTQTFTVGLKDRERRVTEQGWEDVLMRLREETVKCPGCGWGTAYDVSKADRKCVNPSCGKQLPPLLVLKSSRFGVVIVPGAKLYAARTKAGGDIFEVSGEVIQNKNNPQLWGIRNVSDSTWYELAPDGSKKVIEKGGVVRALKGIKVDFGGGIEAVIE